MEQKNLTVKGQVEINAPKDKVWEVLTNPRFIKQWDDLPENYQAGHLTLNSVIEWEGYSRLTVTEFEKNSRLKMGMYLPKVDLDSSKYDVAYSYVLTGSANKTNLAIEIGDFSPLPGSQRYFDTSLEWVKVAQQKIKELAEESDFQEPGLEGFSFTTLL
jgi:uncharacterized protein YndB with AHSA1/START domain